MSRISIQNDDVLHAQLDVLILKYSQGFHGADRAVAAALGLAERSDAALSPGKYLRIPTEGKLPCKRILFFGVPPLWNFGYAEIRNFARESLTILAGEDCERDTVGMTMHGVGYGLDEREAFVAQVAGIMEFLSSGSVWRPRKIVIVERDSRRSERIAAVLEAILSGAEPTPTGALPASAIASLPDAGIASESKQHVFVAMPYAEEMEDVYEFGIREPINAAGCLCERCDRSVFAGDVMDRMKRRIESATVVLADMTDSNPNVYLEVGYAWGKGVPTLLIARDGQKLMFDVSTHRCIFYKSISHLRQQLSLHLPQLATPDGHRS